MTERLILGECLEELAKLEENSIDMVLTDLPRYYCLQVGYYYAKDMWTQFN